MRQREEEEGRKRRRARANPSTAFVSGAWRVMVCRGDLVEVAELLTAPCGAVDLLEHVGDASFVQRNRLRRDAIPDA